MIGNVCALGKISIDSITSIDMIETLWLENCGLSSKCRSSIWFESSSIHLNGDTCFGVEWVDVDGCPISILSSDDKSPSPWFARNVNLYLFLRALLQSYWQMSDATFQYPPVEQIIRS